MNCKLSICALVLTAVSPLSAQLVASHASVPVSNSPTVITETNAKPLVRVNTTVLTDRDLLREEYTIFPYARQHNGTIPKEMEAGIRDGAMKMMIFEELVYQEAVRRKLTIAPAKLQTAIADFRKQFTSADLYKQFLQAECQGSERVMRDKIRRSLLIDLLLKTEVELKSVVSPVELRAFYDHNPSRFAYPESFVIQTISFIPPAKATPQQVEEARKRAEAALPQAKASKNYEEFGLLAEKLSEDDYRVMMGDHRGVDRKNLAPSVLQALQAMQPEQVSGVLQVEQIYTIVRLNNHIPAGQTKFAEVKDRLKKELGQKKTNEVRANLSKRLQQKAKIEVL